MTDTFDPDAVAVNPPLNLVASLIFVAIAVAVAFGVPAPATEVVQANHFEAARSVENVPAV